MKTVTKRILAGGASVLATASIITASTVGPVSAHDNRNDWGKKGHGRQFEDRRIKAYSQLDEELQQHGVLGFNALKAFAFATPDLPAAQAALDENSKKIADIIEKLYPGTHDQFLDLWNKHLGYYADYLTAVKAGDEAAKTQAVNNLATFAKQTDDLLDRKMHWLNRDKNNNGDMDQEMGKLEKQLTKHNQLVMVAVDQLIAGDFTGMYATAAEADDQTEVLARSMAGIWYKGAPKHMEWE